MKNLNLKAELREGKGTGASNAVRREGKVPAVIYGRGEETILVKVNEPEFRKIDKEAGAATIVRLNVEGKETPVIIKEVQMHPIKDAYVHADFQTVSMDEKLRIFIPIVLENREEIKIQPSTLSQQLDEIEIECLPQYLPEDIMVDVKGMEIGDNITVEDLEIAKDENITILRDLDDVICSLSAFIEESEEDLTADTDVDVEPELVTDDDEEEEVEE